MIPVAFGAVLQGIQSLDAFLDPPTIGALDAEDLAECWRTANQLCKACDDLHHKLRNAYADRIIDASHKGTA